MKKLISGMTACVLLLTANLHQAQTLEWADESGTDAILEPVPVGWEEEPLRVFLQAHLQYPQLALENCIEGEVVLLLRFSEQGGVESAKILKGIGYGCDEEALRLAMLFSPPAGMPVASSLKLRIRFRLR